MQIQSEGPNLKNLKPFIHSKYNTKIKLHNAISAYIKKEKECVFAIKSYNIL